MFKAFRWIGTFGPKHLILIKYLFCIYGYLEVYLIRWNKMKMETIPVFPPLIKGWLSIISAAKHAVRRCWFLLTFHVPSNKLHNCFVDKKSSNRCCDLIQIFTGIKQWGDVSLGVFPGTFLYMSTVVKKKWSWVPSSGLNVNTSGPRIWHLSCLGEHVCALCIL